MPLVYPELGHFRAYSRQGKALICRDFTFGSDVLTDHDPHAAVWMLTLFLSPKTVDAHLQRIAASSECVPECSSLASCIGPRSTTARSERHAGAGRRMRPAASSRPCCGASSSDVSKGSCASRYRSARRRGRTIRRPPQSSHVRWASRTELAVFCRGTHAGPHRVRSDARRASSRIGGRPVQAWCFSSWGPRNPCCACTALAGISPFQNVLATA